MRKDRLYPQLFVGTQPSPDQFVPIRNFKLPIKPLGGLWTSTWIPSRQTSDWIEWCRCEQFGDPDKRDWWLLTPDPQARIVTINDHADLKALWKDYSYCYHKGKHFNYEALDFECIADDYDAIHLTRAGQRRTRLTLDINLYGWDCESTCWLRWKFTGIERIHTAGTQR